jgi:hypothetical protein
LVIVGHRRHLHVIGFPNAGVLSDTDEDETITAVEVGDEKKDFVL